MTTQTPKITASAIAVILFSAAALVTHTIVVGLTSPTVDRPSRKNVEYVLPTTVTQPNSKPKRFEF
jgi:hypothetical protein